jgi:conjugative relaxase-like TrwC/TraI family protein
MKVYRGAPSAARNYVEADRSRADDYYLAEGTGVAERIVATSDGMVARLPAMDGDTYEAWVAGLDPDTGEARGRLRQDAGAVRFVEVVVNGPKSWSLAAELHSEIAAAYESAQDRAAAEIVAWLAQNVTTRVGPRGGQVAVPVEVLEAAVVRHYTSRAGDPHRHLHVQVNARVFATGKWRGIDTVAVRDSLGAINGIGHAAVMCDPQFRAALAAHGYSMNSNGDIDQLTEFVGPFSKRAAQVAANRDRCETEWRTAHPGETPGPAAIAGWDRRAWAIDRPDKTTPTSGADLRHRWLTELADLGYRKPTRPVQLALDYPATIDRASAVGEIVSRLGAARSAWNAADIRGEAEQFLARTGVVIDAATRWELAADLTARATAGCVPLARDVPGHVRALTSPAVLAVEDDVTTRFARRADSRHVPMEPGLLSAFPEQALDGDQLTALRLVLSGHRLVVIEGAAGAGKTTLLAEVRRQLDMQGEDLLVVTPTLKAAQVVATETHATAGSAAWLVHQYGWRWDKHGAWTRLRPGERDPVTGRLYRGPAPEAVLHDRSVLLVDEAGMVDQDNARAVLHVADQARARVVLVGDRRQLPAVGRGGVLDLARAAAVQAGAAVTLGGVHRFTLTTIGPDGDVTVPDVDYAALTLAMRDGRDPDAVFAALAGRNQISWYDTEVHRLAAMADTAAAERLAGRSVSVVADTLEQAAALNAAIRARLVTAGHVDDQTTATTGAGERLGVGDVVATRRNDRHLGVANRQTWTVTAINADGGLTATDGVGERRWLPDWYVREHVELVYTTTVYGAQGDTTTSAHILVSERTSAASAYVAMTRGRQNNVAHLVAADMTDARDQWAEVFTRDRTDLGPAHAGRLARHAAADYASSPPAAPRLDPVVERVRLQQVLERVKTASTEQEAARFQLEMARDRLATAERREAVREYCERTLGPLRDAQIAAAAELERARALADASDHAITSRAREIAADLQARWPAAHAAAARAAHTLGDGSGPLGIHHHRVATARRDLAAFEQTWQPVISGHVSGSPRSWAYYGASWPRFTAAIDQYARGAAETELPDHAGHVAHARAAEQDAKETAETYRHAAGRAYGEHRYVHRRTEDTDDLPALQQRVERALARAGRADQTLDQLAADPALATRLTDDLGFLDMVRHTWEITRRAPTPGSSGPTPEPSHSHTRDHPSPSYRHGSGRQDAPSHGISM